MFPSGRMGSYHDPRPAVMDPWAGNYGGFSMPCCSHGYNYYYPPVPATPYTHMYPPYPHSLPHPHVSSFPVPPPYHYHHHQMPAAAPHSYVPPDEYFPPQSPQSYPAWRPIMMPQSNCCCGCPNHQPYYQDKDNQIISNHSINKGIKMQEEEPDDVKRAESVTPVARNSNNGSSQPHLFWIPQYVTNLQHRNEDKGPEGRNTVGQLVPFDFDRLASVHDNESEKPVAAGAKKNFPFPVFWMPPDTSNSTGNTAKNRISEVEEKSSGSNSIEPLELRDGNNERKITHEPLKIIEPHNDSAIRGMQIQNEKPKVKDIPVKQAVENNVPKPSTNADVKSRSRSVSPTKTSKFPAVCLRVDPLPRKKIGNGTPKAASSLASQQKQLQQSVCSSNSNDKAPRNDSLLEDKNARRKEERVDEIHHDSTDPAQKAEVPNFSSEESPNAKHVVSSDEDGKKRREDVHQGETAESVPPSAQPETPAASEEGASHSTKARKFLSDEEAAVIIQSVYRGYEVRRWQTLQKLRQIAKVRERIPCIRGRIQALENDTDMLKDDTGKQRLIIGETIMSLLLTLDTIQGLHPSIRDIRKSVAKELISLQEKLDSSNVQRSRKSEGAADTSEVKEIVCRIGTENGELNSMVVSNNQHENKHEADERENMDGKTGNEETLSESVEFRGPEPQQETTDVADSADQIQEVTQIAPDALNDDRILPTCGHQDDDEFSSSQHLNGLTEVKDFVNTPDSNDLCMEVMDGCMEVEKVVNVGEEDGTEASAIANENRDNVMEELQDATLDEPSSKEEENQDEVNAVSNSEKMENFDIDDVAPQTDEPDSIIQKDAGLDLFSFTTSVDDGEVDSGEVSRADAQLSDSLIASEPKVRCETTEPVQIQMEKQLEHHMGSAKEVPCEQDTDDLCEGEIDAIHKALEEVDKEIDECGKAVENKTWEHVSNFEMISQDEQETAIMGESAELSKATDVVAMSESVRPIQSIGSSFKDDKERTTDSESEKLGSRENSSGFGPLEAEKLISKFPNEKLEKDNAAFDISPATDAGWALIDENEAPYSSSVSQIPVEDAEEHALVEENEKLREAVKKLLEAEKDQLTAISTLNERLKNLEKKLRNKRRKKYKLHRPRITSGASSAMNKSAANNSEGSNCIVDVC